MKRIVDILRSLRLNHCPWPLDINKVRPCRASNISKTQYLSIPAALHCRKSGMSWFDAGLVVVVDLTSSVIEKEDKLMCKHQFKDQVCKYWGNACFSYQALLRTLWHLRLASCPRLMFQLSFTSCLTCPIMRKCRLSWYAKRFGNASISNKHKRRFSTTFSECHGEKVSRVDVSLIKLAWVLAYRF